MFKGYRIAALIPARAGSKGVPGKNIRKINGKPLILHTVEGAVLSGVFDNIFISTDISEMEDIVKEYPVIVIKRPPSLAEDCASGIDVMKHGISFIESDFGYYDIYFYLQPTSPLRKLADIRQSLDLMISKDADYVLSVSQCEHSPLLTNILPSDCSLKDFINRDLLNKNRQDMPVYYRINGAIYAIRNRGNFINKMDFYGDNSYAYVMSQERSIDIDTVLDFKIAEVLLNDPEV